MGLSRKSSVTEKQQIPTTKQHSAMDGANQVQPLLERLKKASGTPVNETQHDIKTTETSLSKYTTNNIIQDNSHIYGNYKLYQPNSLLFHALMKLGNMGCLDLKTLPGFHLLKGSDLLSNFHYNLTKLTVGP